MWGFIASVIKAAFSTFWGRIFPAKTADEQRAEDTKITNDALRDEAKAAETAPTDETAMEALLRKGKL
jgi:hypothetical protein